MCLDPISVSAVVPIISLSFYKSKITTNKSSLNPQPWIYPVVICSDSSSGRGEECSVAPELILLHDGLVVVREAANLLRHDTVFLTAEDVSCQQEKVSYIFTFTIFNISSKA